MRLVLATGNRGKLAELQRMLTPYRVSLHALSEFTDEAAEETGNTFHANALLKARFASRVANLPAIADDSGLEVDALDGAPGVRSARYAGPNATDADNNRQLLLALGDRPASERRARFRCVLAYVESPEAEPVFAEGVWEGTILFAPCGTEGFGYDPLFQPLGFTCSVAELTPDNKDRYSHRAQAMRALVAQLFHA